MYKSSKRMHAMTTVGFDNFDDMPYDKFSSRAENYDYGGVYYIHPPQSPPPYHSYMPSSYYYAVNGGFPALPPTNGQYMSIERSNHSKRAELPKLKDTKLKKNDKRTDAKDKNRKGRKNDKLGDKVSKKAKENSKGMFPILKRISNGIVHGLETFFYKLGMLVSCHPKKTIALCTVISCLLGIGLVKLKLDRDLDGWLIPLDSRIHTDKEWVASHIPFDLRIVQMIVENDNILTKDSLLAMYDLYAASLEIRVDGVGLSDICTNILGNCYITSILDLWDYDKTVIEALTDEEIQEKIKTSELNPRYYTEFDGARILGGRTVAPAGETVGAKATLMAWYLSTNSTFFLVIGAIVGVILAIAASFGICLATGLLFGTTHTGLTFLLLAIGVDDTFVILETWKRVDRENSEKLLEEKMALTMKHAGVSITVTSISDFAAFAAGISSVMPVLSSFCVFSAVGMLTLFIVQATFFPACLYLDQKRIKAARDGFVPCYTHKNYKPNRFSNVEILEPLFKKVWARALLSIPGKVIILLLSGGLIGVMSWSLSKLDKGFDSEYTLHESSFARQFITARQLYFPGEGFPFAAYCDTKDYYAHHKALAEMEEKYINNTAILNGTVISWIRPFKLYLQFIKQYNGDPVVLDDDGFPVGKEVFDEYLYNFIHTSGYGDAYKVYIDVKNSSSTDIDWTIYRMSMVMDEDPVVNMERLNDVRRIADTTYTDGTCFVYGPAFVYIESTDYVDRELLRNFLLAGVSVFIVVLLLVVDLRSSFLVLLCVAFTTICLGGTLQMAGLMIDANLVIMSTFCIGLSVDFSAHIAYVFMTVKGTRNERTQKSLEKIGPAIFHGAASTMIVIACLIPAKSYTLNILFISLLSIMFYGLFAGLCLLPVILSLIGADPYPDAENFQASPDWHNWYNSKLMPRSILWRIPRPQLRKNDSDVGSEKQRDVSRSSNGTFSDSEQNFHRFRNATCI